MQISFRAVFCLFFIEIKSLLNKNMAPIKDDKK